MAYGLKASSCNPLTFSGHKVLIRIDIRLQLQGEKKTIIAHNIPNIASDELFHFCITVFSLLVLIFHR